MHESSTYHITLQHKNTSIAVTSSDRVSPSPSALRCGTGLLCFSWELRTLLPILTTFGGMDGSEINSMRLVL